MAEAHTSPDLISFHQHMERRDELRREEDERREKQRREEERQREKQRQEKFAAFLSAFSQQVTNLTAATSGVTSSSAPPSHSSTPTSPPTYSRAPAHVISLPPCYNLTLFGISVDSGEITQ